MVESWKYYLSKYDYPVQLWKFEIAKQYPKHFQMKIRGDHESTVAFEDYFRENMKDSVEVYYEVVFWKYFSQPQFRQVGTGRIVEHIEERGVDAKSLYQSIHDFTEDPRIRNLKKIRWLLGISSRVLAVPLTLVSFYDPSSFPMIDNVVAKWVNRNYEEHSGNRTHKLTPFDMKYTSLQDNDIENYINWKNWCCEMANALTEKAGILWRARDVEMTIFTYERNRKKNPNNVLPLNPL